jgi:hypothetical protein
MPRALATTLAFAPILALALSAAAPTTARANGREKPRLIVLTDVSNEPDDEESLVRLLVYSNEFDLEGLIATTSVWLRERPRPDLLVRHVEAYAQSRDNLLVHAPGFPAREALLAGVKTGQTSFGMAAVGLDKSTEGSQHVIEVVDRPDPRPVWIAVWGGANTLAQALWDVKYTRTPEELARFVGKLRVYSISDQDDAGRWLRITFPDLFYIVSPSNLSSSEYYRATWTGISGDRHYKNGPGHRFELVDNPWLERNIINGHGALGVLYPKLTYIMEGDTPSFLNLINNGLAAEVDPAWGGWGGRYALDRSYAETRPIYTNTRDTVRAVDGSVHTTAQATIWRWREAFQYDFAARMDWCVARRFADANHNPKVVLNGEPGTEVVRVSARAGETVALSAEGTTDPDGNVVDLSWIVYREAGTCEGETRHTAAAGPTTSLVAPSPKEPCTLHVILQARDNGEPRLYSYRRAIITVAP